MRTTRLYQGSPLDGPEWEHLEQQIQRVQYPTYSVSSAEELEYKI